MQRHELIAAMSALGLKGMAADYDEGRRRRGLQFAW